MNEAMADTFGAKCVAIVSLFVLYAGSDHIVEHLVCF